MTRAAKRVLGWSVLLALLIQIAAAWLGFREIAGALDLAAQCCAGVLLGVIAGTLAFAGGWPWE